MGKSLLLGTRPRLLVTIAGAQAADLPVKAQAGRNIVKICSLYGVGFYYIPGTDMCLKIGGWVARRICAGATTATSPGVGRTTTSTTGRPTTATSRARGYITADARNQSEYGTVRGYHRRRPERERARRRRQRRANTFSANRAFIQWAGFTFGRAQSFFDFYSSPATSYWGAVPGVPTRVTAAGSCWATPRSSAMASRPRSLLKHRARRRS